MCEYCDMTLVYVEEDSFIHKPLHIRNERTGKRIKADGNNPVMYLREYRKAKSWSLICELTDDNCSVIETPVIYCPRCGRRLANAETTQIKYPLYAVIRKFKFITEYNYLYTGDELKRFDPKLYEMCNNDSYGKEEWHTSDKSPNSFVTFEGSRLNDISDVIKLFSGYFNGSMVSWVNIKENDLYGESSSTLYNVYQSIINR